MKICPKCKAWFGDDLNYCLDDGSTLKDAESFGQAADFATTDHATLKYQFPQTAGQNQPTERITYGKPKRKTSRFLIGTAAAVVVLLFAGAVGGVFYLRRVATQRAATQVQTPSGDSPSIPSFPQYPSAPANNIKIEILDQVKSNFGWKYLKCKVTNAGESVVYPYSIALQFYENDVKIGDGSAFVKLKYLKPGQSVPAWVSTNSANSYTSVKVKEPIGSFPIRGGGELFPELTITETKMQPVSTSFKVEGIVENTKYENVSPELYVLFYNENSEIIGIEETKVRDLPRAGKAKFEVTISDHNLFGKPKSFEVIATN